MNVNASYGTVQPSHTNLLGRTSTLGAQLGGERLPHPARDAVACDDQIGAPTSVERADLALELDAARRARRARACRMLEQRLALEPAEPVTGRAQHAPLRPGRRASGASIRVISMSSQRANRVGDLRVRLRIGVGEVAERRVAEHDAEPERVVGAVALVDHDVVLGSRALDEDPEVEPGRAAADAGDLHRRTLPDHGWRSPRSASDPCSHEDLPLSDACLGRARRACGHHERAGGTGSGAMESTERPRRSRSPPRVRPGARDPDATTPARAPTSRPRWRGRARRPDEELRGDRRRSGRARIRRRRSGRGSTGWCVNPPP